MNDYLSDDQWAVFLQQAIAIAKKIYGQADLAEGNAEDIAQSMLLSFFTKYDAALSSNSDWEAASPGQSIDQVLIAGARRHAEKRARRQRTNRKRFLRDLGSDDFGSNEECLGSFWDNFSEGKQITASDIQIFSRCLQEPLSSLDEKEKAIVEMLIERQPRTKIAKQFEMTVGRTYATIAKIREKLQKYYDADRS